MISLPILGPLLKKFFAIPLQKLNLYAALAHFIALVVFAFLLIKMLRPEFQVTQLFRLKPYVPEGEIAQDTINRPLVTSPASGINVPYLITAFFGFTVLFHLLYYFNGGPDGWYTRFVKQGSNPVRFFEYGISAAIMTAVICCLSGVRDINGIWAVTLSITALMSQGAIVEHQLTLPTPDKTTVLYATVCGWLLLLTSWVPITFSLIKAIQDIRNASEEYRNNVPSWIPFFIVLQLLQFSQFGFIQLKQVRPFLKGLPMPSFDSIERQYIINSFTTKLTLGAFFAYGLLQRQRESDAWVNRQLA
jgi:hypothetical protein